MAISELTGAGVKADRGCGSKERRVVRCFASGAKYASKAVAGTVGPAVREMVPFWLIAAVRARGRMHPILLR
jgi:hypothetical protein